MPNEMRDRLIELLLYADAICSSRKQCEGCVGLGKGVDCVNYLIADHLIANGVTVQKWISVEDRLPKDIDTYIVVVKYKYDFEKDFNYATDVATYNPYENAYIDDCWCTFNDWDEGQQYLHITHWMPLPQAPKGE